MSASMRAKHLHLDCFSGVAGDMFLGAMLDLGVPEDAVRSGLATIPLQGYELQVSRTRRMGIEGCDVSVRVDPAAAQPPRTFGAIRELLRDAGLAPAVLARALDIFTRVARAEAKVHGTSLEEVHFHEVGAVDSIVDIVGAAVALEYLDPVHVSARPVPLGHGSVRCAHGVMPVPAPATLEILVGLPVEDGAAGVELCTPTGAAIVASAVQTFGALPSARLLAVGYGAGDGRLQDRANHLRALLLEPESCDPADERIVVLEANIDNMTAELAGYVVDRLFAAGARDVWLTPIVMKKGRPALTLSALCAEEDRDVLCELVLSESTTIGLRHRLERRRVLARDAVEVRTPYGALPVKVARDGERELSAAPEFEPCREAALHHGVPLKEVMAAAAAAYRELARRDGPR